MRDMVKKPGQPTYKAYGQPPREEDCMSTFDDRERGEETKYKHDLELGFKIRNRRNKLFGLWVAQTHLGLSSEEAVGYAKDVVMADFELPGDEDMLGKVK